MIPVGDFIRRRSTPYVNWVLILINVAVFIYTVTLDTRIDGTIAGMRVSDADRFFLNYGFEPACLANTLGASVDVPQRVLAQVCHSDGRTFTQVFSSMFVHAGWAHIFGNMLFLWIFGDNVEDRMGHLRYLAFYLICGIVAAATQTFMSVDTLVPSVGASGAIAGVLGAYLVLYPKAVVQVIILPLFFIPFLVPAVVLIVIWFITQLFSGLAEVGNTNAGGGVAWWAHVGGFVAGAALVWVFKRSRPGPRRVEQLPYG